MSYFFFLIANNFASLALRPISSRVFVPPGVTVLNFN